MIRSAAAAVLLAAAPFAVLSDDGKDVTNPTSAEGRYELGRKYHRGEGVERDPDKAAKWIRLAADAGHGGAQGYLGYLYSKGEGVDKDEDEAIRWMRLAAGQSVPSAQLNLGLILLRQGDAGSRGEAVEWIEKAAAGRHTEAMAKLAEYHHFGLNGVEKDPAKALHWARLAAEGGHTWSENLYGTMLEWGLGTKVDRNAAMDWYRKAAGKGDAKAQASFGRLLASGLVGKRDVVEAYYWLWKSAEQGEATGINFLKDMVPGMSKEERHAALRRVGIEPVQD